MKSRHHSVRPLKRLSRPRSSPLPPLRINDRHIEILRAVALARFLSSDQISRTVGGSHQKNLRRLYKLWRHKFLDRPRNQHAELVAFFDEGNHPLVYGLARKGARLLSQRGLAINHKLDWTTKNVRATPPFFAHTMDIAEIMHAVQRDVRARPGCRLLEHHELVPTFSEHTRAMRDPFSLHVSLVRTGKRVPIALVPDRLFQIVYPDMPAHAFALERDRGSMSIGSRSTSLFKTSFWRKLMAYWHAVNEKQHMLMWGFQSFRILTVTTSDTRIANMIAAEREATDAPAGLFLYSTLERIADQGFLGPAWISAKARSVSLTRPIDPRETTDAMHLLTSKLLGPPLMRVD